MTAPSVVRLATPGDEAEIMKLCHMLHEENGLFPMEDDLVVETIQNAFNKRGVIIGVIGQPTLLEGIICLTVGKFWYSRRPFIEELFNFVHPDYRRSTHARALIEFAKNCATDDTKLLIGVVSNQRTEAKVRLYERQLGKPAGAFFLYP